ncbi:hypothetical protein ACH5RR_010011 [Cinchona calisaya]|uniref:Flavone synthase II n=1 Tax=Cinchona calisaya TaxID=153742 RepID=A0ABD3AHC7_9GENT
MVFMLILLSFTTLLIFLSTLLYHSTLSPKNQKPLRGLPSPLGLPIIGHLHLLEPITHRCLHEMSCRYGPLFHLRLGSVPCVVASDSEMATEFLKTNGISFSSRKQSPAIKLLAYDFSFALAPYGPYWKFIKKLRTHKLLGTRNLSTFENIIKIEVHKYLGDLMRKAKVDEEINVTEEILKLTNNLISQMMLSIRCSEGESDEARTVIREVTQIFGEFDISDIICFCRNFDLQRIRKRASDIHKRYDRLLEKIISDWEKERRIKRSIEANDFLDILLDAMENETCDVKLTRNHIKALILDFFHRGHGYNSYCYRMGVS